jgi:hypothetical protein
MTTIYVSQGMTQYVGGTITETNGKDISTDTFTIALGTDPSTPPVSGWVAPTVSTVGANTASRVVKLLISNSTAPGTWFVWARISDSPEILPQFLQGPIITA